MKSSQFFVVLIALFFVPQSHAGPPAPPVRAMEEIMGKMPDALKLKRADSWDDLTRPKVVAWMNRQLAGAKIEAEVRIFSIDIRPNPDSNPARNWHVTVICMASLQPAMVERAFVTSGVHGDQNLHAEFDINEATAKKWQSRKKEREAAEADDKAHGRLMKPDGIATGTIKSVRWLQTGGGEHPVYSFEFEIVNMKLNLLPLP